MRKTLLFLGVVLTSLLISAGSCDLHPKAPKSGTITTLNRGSVACQDQGVNTVAINYQPSGTDKDGSPWPIGLACVSENQLAQKQYIVGGKYP